MLISACFSHAYTSLVYGVNVSKKARAYKQAFKVIDNTLYY